MSAMWGVQKSLYTALTANATLMTKIGNALYDEPPTNSAYPYITIGSMTESTANRHGKDGFIVTLELRIFTSQGRGGFKSAKEVLELVNQTINLKKFSMDGYTMLMCSYRYSSTERDDDKHIINANYEILCH